MQWTFPQYRKLSNGRSYYRIADAEHFVELQLLGSKVLKYEVHAEQYPEKVLIQDMLNDRERYAVIEAEEFESAP